MKIYFDLKTSTFGDESNIVILNVDDKELQKWQEGQVSEAEILTYVINKIWEEEK